MPVFRIPVRALLAVLLLALAPVAAWGQVGDPADEGAAPVGRCVDTQAPPPTAHSAAAPRSVRRLIAHAAAVGAISDDEAAGFRSEWGRALSVRGRLGGQRRAELTAVVDTIQSFADRGLLTASRMPVLFRQLGVNTTWWGKSGPPAKQATPGASQPCAGGNGTGGNRLVFDDVVYQWYPGQGLQIQQLGTFGRANAMAKACTEPAAGTARCRPAALRRALDAVASLAVDRGGFKAWEYLFLFGRGRPPWISGMAQATAMQALSRGATFLQEPSYLRVARQALGAFRRRAPLGVRVPTSRGAHYLLYSFDPTLRVYNGFMQALVGLYDYAEAADDDEARRLFADGEREMRAWLPTSDTGAWSLYSQGGHESDLGYHRVLRDFTQGLCDRTKRQVYCATAERYTAYLHERTRMNVLSISPLKVRRPVRVRFAISKVSCVKLTVRRGGREVAVVGRTFGRGGAELAWTPARRGEYELELNAKDLVAHNTRITRTVTVR